jgi:hypothetical protein
MLTLSLTARACFDQKQRLSRMSYEAFLHDIHKVDPAVLKFYRLAHMPTRPSIKAIAS